MSTFLSLIDYPSGHSLLVDSSDVTLASLAPLTPAQGSSGFLGTSFVITSSGVTLRVRGDLETVRGEILAALATTASGAGAYDPLGAAAAAQAAANAFTTAAIAAALAAYTPTAKLVRPMMPFSASIVPVTATTVTQSYPDAYSGTGTSVVGQTDPGQREFRTPHRAKSLTFHVHLTTLAVNASLTVHKNGVATALTLTLVALTTGKVSVAADVDFAVGDSISIISVEVNGVTGQACTGTGFVEFDAVAP